MISYNNYGYRIRITKSTLLSKSFKNNFHLNFKNINYPTTNINIKQFKRNY